MPNDYYNHGVYPSPNSPGSSSQLRAELDSIAAGFNKLPTLTSNSYKLVRVNLAGTALEAVNTLPTLNVIDTGFTIQDDVDNTKQAQFQVSGISAGATRVFAFPNASTTIVGTDVSQTLTNKTISGADNTITNVSLTTGVTGTLPIGSGGTNASTAAGARANILPSFTGNANKALFVNPGETDVTYSLINLSAVTGVLPVANGGTNASTASGARVNLLPSFAGKSGYALVINGSETDVEFLPAPGIGLPVQANEGGTGLTSPGAVNNLLTSTGTGWASLPPPITGPSTAKTYFMGQF
jgi:hypothetical protein